MAHHWADWLRLLPPLCLIGVALAQSGLASAAGLSPWLGGGFGMFSTTDNLSARHLHVFVIREGFEREVWPRDSHPDLDERARALPSQANLRRLAREVAQEPSPDHGPVLAVSVQVWRTRFDSKTLLPSSELLRELEVPLSGD